MILCSGAFDGLHAGHVAYLEGAKALAPGEPLYCAVAPDSYIWNHKGREPRWPQSERLRVIQALRAVDTGLAQLDDTVVGLLDLLCPSAFVKGDDYNPLPDDPVVRFCASRNIRILLTPGTGRRHWPLHAL